ncbi:MAG: hypothetical protein ABL869_05405 [Candidatus Nitrotoga sp.]
MAALITWLGSVGVWVGAQIAARWGFKVALIAALLSTFAIMWGIFLAALGAASSLMPDTVLVPFTLQFFPDASAVSTALTAYYGSMLARRSWDFWVFSFSTAAKMGAM